MRLIGGGFLVCFVLATALLGEVLGTFGDPDAAFSEHYATAGARAADLLGATLLALAAGLFAAFSDRLGRLVAPGAAVGEGSSGLVRAAGMTSAMAMFLGALSLATVPLSVSMGKFFGDSAFGQGQSVLPQFGYVLLVFGAMLPAAVMMSATARTRALPSWLSRASWAGAVVLALTSMMVGTLILLPIWVAAVGCRRASAS